MLKKRKDGRILLNAFIYYLTDLESEFKRKGQLNMNKLNFLHKIESKMSKIVNREKKK